MNIGDRVRNIRENSTPYSVAYGALNAFGYILEKHLDVIIIVYIGTDPALSDSYGSVVQGAATGFGIADELRDNYRSARSQGHSKTISSIMAAEAGIYRAFRNERISSGIFFSEVELAQDASAQYWEAAGYELARIVKPLSAGVKFMKERYAK